MCENGTRKRFARASSAARTSGATVAFTSGRSRRFVLTRRVYTSLDTDARDPRFQRRDFGAQFPHARRVVFGIGGIVGPIVERESKLLARLREARRNADRIGLAHPLDAARVGRRDVVQPGWEAGSDRRGASGVRPTGVALLINLKVSCSDRHARKVSIEHVNRASTSIEHVNRDCQSPKHRATTWSIVRPCRFEVWGRVGLGMARGA